jgi:hypothetical protein
MCAQGRVGGGALTKAFGAIERRLAEVRSSSLSPLISAFVVFHLLV